MAGARPGASLQDSHQHDPWVLASFIPVRIGWLLAC
jgi:hypothetical protein